VEPHKVPFAPHQFSVDDGPRPSEGMGCTGSHATVAKYRMIYESYYEALGEAAGANFNEGCCSSEGIAGEQLH